MDGVLDESGADGIKPGERDCDDVRTLCVGDEVIGADGMIKVPPRAKHPRQ